MENYFTKVSFCEQQTPYQRFPSEKKTSKINKESQQAAQKRRDMQ
jgi:hypothetical protein